MEMNFEKKIASLAILSLMFVAVGCVGGGQGEYTGEYNPELEKMLESSIIEEIPTSGLLALAYMRPEAMEGAKAMPIGITPDVEGTGESKGATGMVTSPPQVQSMGMGIFLNKPVGIMTVIDFSESVDNRLIETGFPDAEKIDFRGKTAYITEEGGEEKLVYVKGSKFIILTGGIGVSPENVQELDNPKELVGELNATEIEDFMQESKEKTTASDHADYVKNFVVSSEKDAKMFEKMEGKDLSGFFSMNAEFMIVSGKSRGAMFSSDEKSTTFFRADSILTKLIQIPEEGESVLVGGESCKKSSEDGKTGLFCEEEDSIYWIAYDKSDEDQILQRTKHLLS